MPDLTVTTTSVTLVSGPTAKYNAGYTLTQGMVVFLDAANLLQPSSTASTTASAFAGIVMCAASTNQPAVVAQPGAVVTLGTTLTVGACYVVSDNAGKIAADSDLGAGDYVTQIGRGITTARLQIDGIQYGVAHG